MNHPLTTLQLHMCAIFGSCLLVTACGGGGGGGGNSGGGPVPTSGTWGGLTPDGDIVNFTVDANGIKEVFAEFCDGSTSASITPSVALAADGSFTLTDATDSITGTVRSDGTASGTLRHPAACGPAERSWTASRKSDRTDIKTPVGELVVPATPDFALGAVVTLTGRVNGTPVGNEVYNWTLTKQPPGSTATLPSTATTSFTAAKEGEYVVRFFVGNGVLIGPSASIVVRAGAPTARFSGLAESGFGPMVVGVPTVLDASRSTDLEGGPLTYNATLVSAPAGSTAVIANPTSPRASLVPDIGGVFSNYVVELSVSDGISTSMTTRSLGVDDRSSIAPFADPGPDQDAVVGVAITLDGSRSAAIDGSALSYAWRVQTRPAGSVAAIEGAAAAIGRFTPDVAGSYTITLNAKDAVGWPFGSDKSITVTAGTGNARPVASAGPDRTVAIGTTVTLDATASRDANTDALSYRWALLSKPAGSVAALSSGTVATPTMAPDKAGLYVVQLVAADATTSSAPVTLVVTAR